MKENEIRFGNLIYCNTKDFEPLKEKEVYEIDESLWQRIGDCVDKFEWYEPIPLTEEWLLKFGFEKGSVFCGNGINENLYFYDLNGYKFSEDVYGKWYLNGYNWNTEHFSYVHQLQNLYFALAGEELIINNQ